MSKLNILLDLDQTLISAEPTEEYDFKKNKEKVKKFKKHDMDGYYFVFERPGLQDFLTFLFANFNVSIWTAASKDYALFVINKAILAGHTDRKIDYIFFSYHCDVSKDVKKGSKDLTILWDVYNVTGYTPENTVILDDYNEVYDTQRDNCIVAPPFEFTHDNSESDSFLKDLTTDLTQLLADYKDGKSIKEDIKKMNEKVSAPKHD
jgi:TFIIF-interacting CTD phosphatase-like protein